MAEPKAFKFTAAFGSRAPYRIISDGVVLALELPESALDIVTALYKAGKNKELTVLIEVTEPRKFSLAPVADETTNEDHEV